MPEDGAEPEVGDLETPGDVKEQVLGLEVSVTYALVVDVLLVERFSKPVY